MSWEKTKLILGIWSTKLKNRRNRLRCWRKRRSFKRRSLRNKGSRLWMSWQQLRLKLPLSKGSWKSWRISIVMEYLIWNSYQGLFRIKRLRKMRLFRDLRIWKGKWSNWINSRIVLRDRKKKWRRRKKRLLFRLKKWKLQFGRNMRRIRICSSKINN